MESRIGFGKRFLAVLIDGILCMVGGFLIGGVVGGMFGGLTGAGVVGAELASQGAEPDMAVVGQAMGGAMGAMLGGIIGFAVFALLYNLTEIFLAATPGKMALKIIVRNEDGTPADNTVLATRYAIKNIMNLFTFVAAITGVFMLATLGNFLGLIVFLGCFLVLGASRQALHDKIAHTAVYRR